MCDWRFLLGVGGFFVGIQHGGDEEAVPFIMGFHTTEPVVPHTGVYPKVLHVFVSHTCMW